MDERSDPGAAGQSGALAAVDALTDIAAEIGRTSAQLLLTRAQTLHLAYRSAVTVPEAFARGSSLAKSEAATLVERSIRAEFAAKLRLSERATATMLEHARLLVEDLPRIRDLLAEGRLLWESSEIVCATAATLPATSRGRFDERAAEVAPDVTPTQLRRIVARLRDELHEEPLAQRHVRARQDRAMWISPEVDGMATLCALLPAPDAMGIADRVDRIARSLRDGGDERTLGQLKADVLTDLLRDGDIAGTTPADDGPQPSSSFVPGIRAEVRLTLAASTAVGLDDAPADLDGYGLIPADLARELVATGASFTRVLTDPDTRAVRSVGRTHRVPPPRMRLHLQLRDQTCRFPGCTRTASRAEADHTIEWRNGGETSLENLVSLCTSHHHVRHGDRWTYVPARTAASSGPRPPGASSRSTHPHSPAPRRAPASGTHRPRSDGGGSR
ncbi:HNH endonuclease signature motif containing protein [Rathayibacter sp. VKM Ac-2760]|uniref:HNH endonuclease signature motif containing protein n=1 Tax=Rathayibacter sp. VKM Ac-2760 TaxID=2609253 RepID=UPI001318EA4A|nr:HNH endonuclease signature motif containing protein [Rathayibacter sp. VKM Ac-2760]QHC60197.1 DUF222 domain-containing protein [Rathayibacter sp. VKM Ac-2760]